ncbi:MAG: OmpW family outer membrane protein [Hyphomicrobium sp.]|nr:OmpW family outer membrane protein [Hyphomicrobium sp.]
MMKTCSARGVGFVVAMLTMAGSAPALAGSESGDVMVRVLATGVLPDTSAGGISVNGAANAVPAGSYEISDEVIPALTLSYFVTKNVALELFCCFAKHDVEGEGALAGVDIADTWIFPPAVTLQYHFDNFGAFKPYAGVGFQYINFFNTDSKDPGGSMSIDDAVGFTLQAGIDISLGGGWYLNADVKKTWLETEWTINDAAGDRLHGSFDLDPIIVSAGVGYRFDLFGSRTEVPLK